MKTYRQPMTEIHSAGFLLLELSKHDKQGDGQMNNSGFFDDMDDSFVNSGKGLWEDKDEEK